MLRSGLLLVLTTVISATVPSFASALEPCDAGVPTGKVVYEGSFTQIPAQASSRALRRAGVVQRPIRPATSFAGEIELPVETVSRFSDRTVIQFRGGVSLSARGRSVAFRKMRVVLRPGAPRAVVARAGSRQIRLFALERTKLRREKGRVSEIELSGGLARLTTESARLMRNRLGLRDIGRGTVWSRPDLFVRGAGGQDLVGELPPEAPVIEQPEGSIPVESASITWRIRESFVNYLNGGGSVTAIQPASPGPAESIGGRPELVYDFDLPLSSGWVADESQSAKAVVKGSGGVWFRLCKNTINFTLTDPEIVLDGDSSTLVVEANGTDGSPYDGRRVTVLRLFPSRATRAEVNGRQTVLEGIPAYVADGATGVFISYPAFPGFEDRDVELSRFGSVSVTYTRAATG